jgi:hypothetical protein
MDVQTITHPQAVAEPPKQWDTNRGITKALKEAIEDKAMPPEKKAVTVYEHSQLLMAKLFTEPTAEAIGASKEAIGNVADLIIADDETALNLLKITSHDFYTYAHSVNFGVLGIYADPSVSEFKNSRREQPLKRRVRGYCDASP